MDNRPDFCGCSQSRKFYVALSERLTVYVKHLAWLHSVPDGQSETRGKQFSGSSIVELPSISGGEHVAMILREIGYAVSGDPISNQELYAWVQVTGIQIDCWTARMITTLSSEYLSQYRISNKIECPAPFVKTIADGDLQEAGRLVSDKLKALAKRKSKT